MFVDPMTRESLNRPCSQTKSQMDLDPKLELTCLVSGVVSTLSVWITTTALGRLIYLRTQSVAVTRNLKAQGTSSEKLQQGTQRSCRA